MYRTLVICRHTFFEAIVQPVYSLLLVAAVVAAWGIGGPVGVVTIAAMLALGPVTSAVRRWSLVW